MSALKKLPIYLGLAIIFVILFLIRRSSLVREGLRGNTGRSYYHSSSTSSSSGGAQSKSNPNSYKPPNLFKNELIDNATSFVGGSVLPHSDGSSIIGSNIVMIAPVSDIYDNSDMSTKPVSNLINKPDTSLIINDSCSSRGFLVSDYVDDICTKYEDDNDIINEKCEQLSKENCNIPSCCVYLNGSKCVAGNVFGPTFLTEDGNKTDFKFYHYKNQCYGNCDSKNSNSLSECTRYADNSIGVSKECMVQIFNSMGCPNLKPSLLINKDMEYTFAKSSRKYITKYLARAVSIIKKYATGDKSQTDNDSHNLCYGETKV